VLEYAAFGTEYSTYLKLKQEYGATPSFYMDAADFFTTKGKVDTAVVILSNLSELQLEVPQLLRVLGSKLMNLKQYKEAVSVYQKVLDIKGEEPQSYRDLGLAYEAAGDRQKAVNTLYEVIKKNWDGRFQDIEIIVLNEINRIMASSPGIDHSFIDDRLIKQEPVDIRVVLTWDTDNCDMDLWVTDPAGEKCFYEHKLTRNGGKISDDFTQGYGPEEFMIRKAIPGEYVVHVNYFGTSSQAVLAPVNLHVTFYTNYGSSNQKQQDVVLRLMNAKEVVEVGKFQATK
jgi:tetratricopeptide (TPR) repeat protein